MIFNDKGLVIVDIGNIKDLNNGKDFLIDVIDNGIKEIIKIGKVDYKYVIVEGNIVLEENKN